MREALYAVFGPRALAVPLFYAHEGALRFELSRGGTHLDQFEQAFDRGREILDFLFRDTETLTVVLTYFEGGRLLGRLSAFRPVRRCGVRIERPREAWVETTEEGCDGDEQTFVAFAVGKEALHRLLWGACAVDLGVRPRLDFRVYLADLERGVLAHPYDDRGMDVIGPNRERIAELFERFESYLLDYDRARMEAFFRPDAGNRKE